jgi:hypothetical protein
MHDPPHLSGFGHVPLIPSLPAAFTRYHRAPDRPPGAALAPCCSRGLHSASCSSILDRARAKKLALLWVHASLTAEPAFSALGFVVRQREQVTVGGEVLDRFKMEMIL